MMSKLKLTTLLSVLIIFLLSVNLLGCQEDSSTTSERRQTEFLKLFDTATIIVAYTETEEEFQEYVDLIQEELTIYHQLYDIYNNYSGVSNLKTINENAGISPVSVDQRIIDLLLFSKEAYAVTQGRVNVAFGAVLSIWHEYRTVGKASPESAQIPPMNELLEASLHTNIEDVVIDDVNNTVFLKDPAMRLDVGAVAKGFAVERVTEYAREAGFTDGLISVGGNLRAIGTKGEAKELWSLGIQNPDRESDLKDLFIIEGTELSLVTSGDYQRFYTVDGVPYHHIIHPDTLMPAPYFTAVTIITEDSGWADALSTAVFNMPYEEGLLLIEGIQDTEGVWVFPDGELRYTSGFSDLL
jgi:thiamine biosynthesis lipoprotein